VLSVLGVVALLARLLFGADFADEAFYAATAYRFAMGARPFVDDLDIHQLAGWLVSPWVRVHLLVFGDTTGIILSLRILWALLGAGAAYLWYRALRPLVDRRLAMLACACGFAAIPFLIPAPSYNTVAYLLGSMALALIAAASRAESGWVQFVAAGALLGLACVAYPTFVVVAVIGVAGAWWLSGSWKRAALVLAGGALVAGIVVVMLLPYLRHAPRVLEIAQVEARKWGFGGSREGGVLGRLINIARAAAKFLRLQPAVWLALAAALVIVLRRRVPWWLGSAAVASLAFIPFMGGVAVSTLQQAMVILFSGLIIVSAQAIAPSAEQGSRNWLPLLVVAYGLVCGLVFSVTSSNSWLLLGIGGMCVLAPVLAFLFAFCREALGRGPLAAYAPLASILVAGVVLAGVIGLDATGTFHDPPPTQLLSHGSLVRTGPYAGIITTRLSKVQTEALWSTMKRETTSADILLSYHAFPAGYLFSPARPAVPLLWTTAWDGMHMRELTDLELQSMSSPATRPTVVLRSDRMTAVARARLYDPSIDRLEKFIDKNYRWVVQSEQWRLGRPR
jgi:hypothetical protein